MPKFVCEHCDKKFDTRKETVKHEKKGECIRWSLDLIYRCVNQCLAEGEWDDFKKYMKETKKLLKRFNKMTGSKYCPTEKIQNFPYGRPLPYDVDFGEKKVITPNNLNNVFERLKGG